MPEASDNDNDNDSDEEDQDGDTDDLEIGAHYKNPFFTNSEKKSCPNVFFGRMTYTQMNLFLDDIDRQNSIQINLVFESN